MGGPIAYKLNTEIGSGDLTEQLKQKQRVTDNLFKSQALRYDPWTNQFYLLGYFGSGNRGECEYRFRKINMEMSLEYPDKALEKILEQEKNAGLEPCSFDTTKDEIVVAERNQDQDEYGSLGFYNKKTGVLRERRQLEHEGYNRIVSIEDKFLASYRTHLENVDYLDNKGSRMGRGWNKLKMNFAADRQGYGIVLNSSIRGYTDLRKNTFQGIEPSADSLLLDNRFYNISSKKGFRVYTNKGELLHASDIPETEHIERAAIIEDIEKSENHGCIALVYNDIEEGQDKSDRKRVHTKLKLIRLLNRIPDLPP